MPALHAGQPVGMSRPARVDLLVEPGSAVPKLSNFGFAPAERFRGDATVPGRELGGVRSQTAHLVQSQASVGLRARHVPAICAAALAQPRPCTCFVVQKERLPLIDRYTIAFVVEGAEVIVDGQSCARDFLVGQRLLIEGRCLGCVAHPAGSVLVAKCQGGAGLPVPAIAARRQILCLLRRTRLGPRESRHCREQQDARCRAHSPPPRSQARHRHPPRSQSKQRTSS